MRSVKKISISDSEASIGLRDNILAGCSIVPVVQRVSFGENVGYEINSRFLPRVLILDSAFESFVFLHRIYDCREWSYPSSISRDNFFGRHVSLFSHSVGLLLRGISLLTSGFSGFSSGFRLLFDRLVNLDHFVDLPTHGAEGNSNQYDRYPLAKFFSAVSRCSSFR